MRLTTCAGSAMPPSMPLGGEVESNAAAAAVSAASAAAHAAAAAVMNQPVASVQASTETMEQVSTTAKCCQGQLMSQIAWQGLI